MRMFAKLLKNDYNLKDTETRSRSIRHIFMKNWNLPINFTFGRCRKNSDGLRSTLPLDSYNSADVYNLHGAKRLVTIPNVLSASCPSVNQDGENKPFLHIDCFT